MASQALHACVTMSRPRSEDTVQRAFRHEPGPLVIARGGRRETVEPVAKKIGIAAKTLEAFSHFNARPSLYPDVY